MGKRLLIFPSSSRHRSPPSPIHIHTTPHPTQQPHTLSFATSLPPYHFPLHHIHLLLSPYTDRFARPAPTTIANTIIPIPSCSPHHSFHNIFHHITAVPHHLPIRNLLSQNSQQSNDQHSIVHHVIPTTAPSSTKNPPQ